MARSLQKKTRFEVFKRDEFICQFCGRTPPQVVLEVDHIVPVCKGGANSIDNLTTACFDCNRGKGATSLEKVPLSVTDKAAILGEKELQLKAYNRALKAKHKRLHADVERIASMFESFYEGWTLTDKFKSVSIRMFLERLPFEDVRRAMELTCSRIVDSGHATKYFCGICWRLIKGNAR